MAEGVRVLLIRHGESVWNRENRWQGHADIPLSETGRIQAQQLARHIKSEQRPIRAFYTSDLQRARETAHILGRTLGMTPTPTAAWREMNIGTWSGLTTAEVVSRYPEEWERLRQGEDLPRGGGETFAEFQGRLLRAIHTCIETHVGQDVAVVTHGGAVRALLLHCKGWAVSRFGDIEKIGNTGVSEIFVSPNGDARIERINCVAHLDHAALAGETVEA